MSVRISIPSGLLAALALCAGLALAGSSASAQESVMKQCGDKWQAAKAAGTTANTTWPKFLGECRAQAAAQPAAAPAAPAATTAAKPAVPATTAAKPAAPVATGPVSYPTAIAPEFASEKPARARLKTCGKGWKEAKASGSTGGLKWIQKGGGYWPECNRRLKA